LLARLFVPTALYRFSSAADSTFRGHASSRAEHAPCHAR
jgi:hypothetical protein